MNTYQEMVEEFHQGTNSTIGEYPELRDRELRAKLIMEEAVETVAAMGYRATAAIWDHRNQPPELGYTPEDGLVAEFEKHFAEPDFVEVIDGLCDLLYVTYGAAVAAGLDLDPFFSEVHRSNMDKLKGPKREDGKQLKPEGWQPPDIAGRLAAATAYADVWRGLTEIEEDSVEVVG